MAHAPGYSLRFGVSTKCLSCFRASERGFLSCMTKGKHCTPLKSLECRTSSGSFGPLVGRKVNLYSLAMMGWLGAKKYFSREYLFVEDTRTTWSINLQHNCRSLIVPRDHLPDQISHLCGTKYHNRGGYYSMCSSYGHPYITIWRSRAHDGCYGYRIFLCKKAYFAISVPLYFSCFFV